jgi:CRISPR-associated protein Cmr2
MKYIALTIGPIYKTISKAKKPKELFAGSYVFSYVMRKIIENFKDREFITPYIKDKNIFEETELGLFHDRFIFKSKDGDLEKLEKVIDEVLKELSNNLNVDFNHLKEYFQINYVEKELEENDNPILKLSPYLDSKELFFQTSQHSDEILKALTNRESFLLENKKIRDNLKYLSSKKYFAIIHADGDNMSKVIQKKEKIKDISKSLFDYCIESNEAIKNFGGQTIFAGGDDLLFFAPVYNDKKETIFDLCSNISDIFDKKIENKSASLSFGISIQYHKFPLYEALEESRRLLFAKAKSEPKNNIAFKIQKHSGQSVEAVIYKGNKEIYNKFLSFTSTLEEKEEVGNFLHSIHHKIDSYKNIINQIGNNKDKLTNFFENYFNEDEHKKYESFFKNLVEFINLIYKNENIKKDEKLNLIYSTLRFVKFVKGDKK